MKPNEYKKLQQTITTELGKIDEQQNPGEVPRLVISAASNLNYDNNTDSKSVESRKEIRTILIEKLTSVQLTDNKQAQIRMSALIEVSQEAQEFSSASQSKAADLMISAGSLLQKGSENLGPVEVEENARTVFTAASNLLDASNVTSRPFIEEVLKKSLPTKAPPSRDWAVRKKYLENEEDAHTSGEAADKAVFFAIDLVSEAILSKRIADEGEVKVNTSAFNMKLQRTSIDANMSINVTDDSDEVLVKLPKVPESSLKDSKVVDIQFTSMTNPFLSDPHSSPFINPKIQGFSLKQESKDITLENLEEDLEMLIPVNLVSSRFKANFTSGVIKTHRYQIIQDMPYEPMILQVKAEDGSTLKVSVSLEYEESNKLYNLNGDSKTPFRKNDDDHSFIAEHLPEKPLYVDVMVARPEDSSLNMTVNYTVSVYFAKCMYWDRLSFEWRDRGCKVGYKTSRKFTHCLCNHATFFGSLNVEPNPISTPTFEKLKDGYAMLIFVSVIFLLYFVGLIWARRKDRADVVKVGVCPLPDNDPSDPYRYEVTLWTSMRRNAGTKSKVSMIVYGDEHDSEARSLEDPDRQPFRRGSQDTFLMTTPFELGTVQFIRIWHDNAGGSWFLSRVMVIDLQTDERSYFICNRWLAVDEDDGQVERIVPLASQQELTEFGHLFVARTRRNLSDSHLWFSVLARPANSRFTRVQRLSCCLCLLLMSMMASGMYYGRPSNGVEVEVPGMLVFSWQEVLIGVISSLIVFPINLFVVQIFRNVRPKPKVKPKRTQEPAKLGLSREQLDTYNQLKELSDESTKGSNNSLDLSRDKNNMTRLSINDVHPDVDRASFTQSPLLFDRRPSTTYDNVPKSRFRRALLCCKKKISLPYYFLYVAWALVFIFSVGSAVMVVFYGMQFQNKKSLQWLVSSSVSFVQDVVITQPLKVLGLAVFFALVVKKPDQGEFQITEEAKQLAEDEDFLLQSSSNQGQERNKKIKLLPPDQARLIAMRTARMKERKMYSVIREVITYYIFLTLLLTIAYTHRSPVGYIQTRNMINTMAGNFSKICSVKEFWNWTHSELIPGLFPAKRYNDDPIPPDGFMADGSSQMVGGARMRLIRIKRESCQVPSEVYGITRECYGEYFIGKDDKHDYNVGWQNVTEYHKRIRWDDMMWRYQNASVLDGYPVWARLNTYSGGGYIIVLEPSMKNVERVKELEKNMWIERHTRAIVTEFTIYNAQTNLFSVVTLVAEFPATGSVIPHSSVQTIRLYNYTNSLMFFVFTIDILYVLFILFFTYREIKNIYKTGIRAYIKEFWNCVECGIIAFTYAAIALYVYRFLTYRNVLDQVKKTPFTFKSFQFAAYWDDTYTFCLAVIVMLANIKLNKLLRFNKRFSLLSSTLKYAYYPLLMFSIVWGIVFIAFTFVAALVFGPSLWSYRNIMASLTSLLSLMLGRTTFFDLRDTNRILGPIFFFCFMFMMSFVLINMFVSIVIDAFWVVKHDNDKQSNEYEIVDFIIERFKLWSGIGGTRKPHPKKRVLWETAASRIKAINAFQDNSRGTTIAGLRRDGVSELETRLEKLIDRTDVLYDEIFPEKKRGNIVKKIPGRITEEDVLEGYLGAGKGLKLGF